MLGQYLFPFDSLLGQPSQLGLARVKLVSQGLFAMLAGLHEFLGELFFPLYQGAQQLVHFLTDLGSLPC
ncbi:hypothetical protein DP23_4110 [Ralstonia pickettii]|nr:hypothetical protein DP23_4110 [Ralstonia pickettii]